MNFRLHVCIPCQSWNFVSLLHLPDFLGNSDGSSSLFVHVPLKRSGVEGIYKTGFGRCHTSSHTAYHSSSPTPSHTSSPTPSNTSPHTSPHTSSPTPSHTPSHTSTHTSSHTSSHASSCFHCLGVSLCWLLQILWSRKPIFISHIHKFKKRRMGTLVYIVNSVGRGCWATPERNCGVQCCIQAEDMTTLDWRQNPNTKHRKTNEQKSTTA